MSMNLIPRGPAMTAIVVTTRQCCDQNRRLIAQSRDHSARSRRLLNRWWGISGGSVEPPVVPTDATSTHWPLDELERLVRDKLRRGALFVLTNGKVWAGPATGRVCRVCSQTISRGNECEVRGRRGPVYTHLLCHSIWRRESQAHCENPGSSS